MAPRRQALIGATEIVRIRKMDLGSHRVPELLDFAEHHRERYQSNEPFPHIVLDGFFPAVVLDDILLELQDVVHQESRHFFAAKHRSLTYDIDRLGPTTQRFLIDLNSTAFCSFLEGLTGVEGLLGDASLFGGGFQEMGRGGYLKMHADFTWHERLRLDRRVNLLVYLNRDWRAEWGGDLLLSRPQLQHFTRVAPAFNRAVIFATTDSSFHGVPDPITCPQGLTRKALAVYYYTNGRPAREIERGRSTRSDYRRRPDETFEDAPEWLRRVPARLVQRGRGLVERWKRTVGGRGSKRTT